tara:strand:- start:331 stop:756 length:426 start_codon:yes stop_codon:yes gene_type:complete
MKLPHNRTWYTKKLVEKAKRYVKLRDNYTCQYCGKKVEGSNCHASHVLNVGTHKNMELDVMNMKVLCSYHHMHWWHKDVLHATEWFKEKFPDRYKYLMEQAKRKYKHSTADLAILHDETEADGSDFLKKYNRLFIYGERYE